MEVMSTKSKVMLSTVILWLLNIVVFLLLSNYEQILLIEKYSDGFLAFFYTLVKYYLEFFKTISSVTLLLTGAFIITLFFFWFYYFSVYFYKLPSVKKNNSIVGIVSTVFSFLGFGCVACGQTLLTSFLLLFVSTANMFVLSFLGNFVLLVSSMLLLLGIHTNYKILRNPNLCRF